MSICQSGVNSNIQAAKILINITEQHPLIQLGQALPWQELVDLILPDLKKTAAGKWWLGRKLKVRTHLGVYLLQHLLNKTDRQIEYDIKDNAAYQIFAGRNIVEKWHAPDHTKIEEFRSRLSEETQKKLANHMATHSVKLGFGDPSEVDFDSTVQEANMAYPADSCLLKKLGSMAAKVVNFIGKSFKKGSELASKLLPEATKNPSQVVTTCFNNAIENTSEIAANLRINLKKIGATARAYFFLSKKSTKEAKSEKLTALLNVVREEIHPVIGICEALSDELIKKLPWNQKVTVTQIKTLARQYLNHVETFLVTGVMVPTKLLSFHLKSVVCFTKGKLGKKYQFGRAFQLGRIKGNFLFVAKCTSPQMPDKSSIKPLIEEHQNLFNAEKINSVSTDKGYYSKKNEKFLASQEINEIGIQRPHNILEKHPKPMTEEVTEKLINRRSGIEPLIGHAKQGGQLGRSRMKSDKGMETSGYTSILGFNMRQLIRHQKGKMKEKVA